jgi:hypothetical protein
LLCSTDERAAMKLTVHAQKNALVRGFSAGHQSVGRREKYFYGVATFHMSLKPSPVVSPALVSLVQV